MIDTTHTFLYLALCSYSDGLEIILLYIKSFTSPLELGSAPAYMCAVTNI
jgi:hypothetical protein